MAKMPPFDCAIFWAIFKLIVPHFGRFFTKLSGDILGDFTLIGQNFGRFSH
jgi:hypothetical protein